MKNENLSNIYLELLIKEGYSGKLVSEKIIEFEHEGKQYSILLVDNENGKGFVHLMYCGAYHSKDDNEKARLLYALNTVNREKYITKTYMEEKGDEIAIYTEVSILAKEPNDFFDNFSLFLDLIWTTRNYFLELMERSEK